MHFILVRVANGSAISNIFSRKNEDDDFTLTQSNGVFSDSYESEISMEGKMENFSHQMFIHSFAETSILLFCDGTFCLCGFPDVYGYYRRCNFFSSFSFQFIYLTEFFFREALASVCQLFAWHGYWSFLSRKDVSLEFSHIYTLRLWNSCIVWYSD